MKKFILFALCVFFVRDVSTSVQAQEKLTPAQKKEMKLQQYLQAGHFDVNLKKVGWDVGFREEVLRLRDEANIKVHYNVAASLLSAYIRKNSNIRVADQYPVVVQKEKASHHQDVYLIPAAPQLRPACPVEDVPLLQNTTSLVQDVAFILQGLSSQHKRKIRREPLVPSAKKLMYSIADLVEADATGYSTFDRPSVMHDN